MLPHLDLQYVALNLRVTCMTHVIPITRQEFAEAKVSFSLLPDSQGMTELKTNCLGGEVMIEWD